MAGDEGRFVLIDGYKRVRALRKLTRDRVRATTWAVDEGVLAAGAHQPLEQQRFGVDSATLEVVAVAVPPARSR